MKRRVLALAVVAAALVGAQAAASAPGPVEVTGSYLFTGFDSEVCAENGAPFVLRCTVTGFGSTYTGDLEGTSVTDFVQHINCKTGRTIGHGTETFTGSVDGIAGTGTLTWGIHFEGVTDCATFALSSFSATGVGNSSSGALAGLNTNLRFGLDTYEGTLR